MLVCKLFIQLCTKNKLLISPHKQPSAEKPHNKTAQKQVDITP